MIKKLSIHKYPLVLVVWTDAYSNSEWFSKAGLKEWCSNDEGWIVANVGWLIEKTKHQVVIASRYSPEKEEQFGNLQKIPRTWVKLYRLKSPKVTYKELKN
jgi:hypothetical protein